jgi:hypothetical protein
MSDNAQLARTGTAAGAIVIGSTVVTGYWLIAAAGGIVLLGALLVRLSFRRGQSAGDQ